MRIFLLSLCCVFAMFQLSNGTKRSVIFLLDFSLNADFSCSLCRRLNMSVFLCFFFEFTIRWSFLSTTIFYCSFAQREHTLTHTHTAKRIHKMMHTKHAHEKKKKRIFYESQTIPHCSSFRTQREHINLYARRHIRAARWACVCACARVWAASVREYVSDRVGRHNTSNTIQPIIIAI